VVGDNKRRSFHLLVGTVLAIGTSVIGSFLTSSLAGEQGLLSILGWFAAGILVTFFYLRWQLRSQEESPGAIKERVRELASELRKQVQTQSYGMRSKLIEAPLRELDLDITPRVGLVRDPRLLESEPLSEHTADEIVAAFQSSRRRLLIVGEPGSGKTMAAYSLIEYLDEREGDERIPLLVNLSAWEAQDDFEAFLVDYLCSSVGYQVRERATAHAFISSRRYTLILDGLDEVPPGLRTHFPERLDEFVGGLQSEVGVVVTCRTQEYEELLAAHPTGLGLVQAVEILPLTSQQLDSAFVELAKREEGWQEFLSQRHHTAYQRVRDLLSNPLFLNLAVVGRLSPGQLLDWTTTEQELRDLVLDRYLDHTLADQSQYELADARHYLTWVARFLNGVEVSPFGLKSSDATVFDLANLTPPEPPKGYRLFAAFVFWLIVGLGFALVGLGLDGGLGLGLIAAVLSGWAYKRSAVSSRLTFVWPSTGQQRRDFLARAGRALVFWLGVGLVGATVFWLGVWLIFGLVSGLAVLIGSLITALIRGLIFGLIFGLGFGLTGGLVFGLVETRSLLITLRTPKEASTRSLITALAWLGFGLVGGLVGGLIYVLVFGLIEALVGLPVWLLGTSLGRESGLIYMLVWRLSEGLIFGLVFGLIIALVGGLDNGGWFVLLQKIAQRRLARASKLPSRPYDFLEWGIERQIFRRVGGGVRFRHNLIQQHLASTSD
jgi:hypothetical protein